VKIRVCVLFVLSAVLLFAVIPTCAALTDEENEALRQAFAEYSDDELKFLFESVQYELMLRGYKFDFDESHEASAQVVGSNALQKDVTVPPGEYTIGKDIPAGTYTVAGSGIIALLFVSNPDGSRAASHAISGTDEIGKLVLTDGQSIEITGTAVVFKPYNGLGF